MNEFTKAANALEPQSQEKEVWVTPVLISADVASRTEGGADPSDTEGGTYHVS